MDRETATALLEKHGLKPGGGTRGLTGSRRAECKAALNWLARNPEAPKPKRKKKKKTPESTE